MSSVMPAHDKHPSIKQRNIIENSWTLVIEIYMDLFIVGLYPSWTELSWARRIRNIRHIDLSIVFGHITNVLHSLQRGCPFNEWKWGNIIFTSFFNDGVVIQFMIFLMQYSWLLSSCQNLGCLDVHFMRSCRHKMKISCHFLVIFKISQI